jgi:inosine/xanthosine triphosphate pyrophosphatase family protein
MIRIVYVTTSKFKRDENKILTDECTLSTGNIVGKTFSFQLRNIVVPERLEVDLSELVKAEVKEAYARLRVACIVEHAGLIFDDYRGVSYPGGLTKPMWNTLDTQFIKETNSAGRRAIARAVVAYCDGQSIKTFVGETPGKISDAPRGSRNFYWDTVFIPDDGHGAPADRTYAEICDDPAFGLKHKVVHLSQSTKAMLKFLEHRLATGAPELWP